MPGSDDNLGPGALLVTHRKLNPRSLFTVLSFLLIASGAPAAERTVNLSSLDEAAPAGTSNYPSGSRSRFGGATTGSGDRALKAFFDLALFSQPGAVDLSFGNFHAYVFMDIFPKNGVQFSFDLSSSRGSPSFYELDWQITPWFQLRLGKIWVPFDDMSPHNLFGGRVNVSTLAPQGTAPFLPDLWTDLGVGGKFTILDTTAIELTSYLYAVNGFRATNSDPVNSGASYPSFDASPIIEFDNNKDKALGGRLYLMIARKFGVGVSGYTARWNNQADEAKRVNIIGVDTQLFLKAAEVRLGLIAMKADVLGDTITRGGAYGEFGIPIGKFKVIARGGTRQQDDRVLSAADQTIVGGALLYKHQFMQVSAEYTRDIKERPNKVGADFYALRSVFEL